LYKIKVKKYTKYYDSHVFLSIHIIKFLTQTINLSGNSYIFTFSHFFLPRRMLTELFLLFWWQITISVEFMHSWRQRYWILGLVFLSKLYVDQRQNLKKWKNGIIFCTKNVIRTLFMWNFYQQCCCYFFIQRRTRIRWWEPCFRICITWFSGERISSKLIFCKEMPELCPC